MQRYFVSPRAVQGDEVRITGDDVKHIVRVMRYTTGDEIICADGAGNAYIVRLAQLEPDVVIGAIVRSLDEKVESEVKITLVQGLPKGDKMDMIVQKCTEVGAMRVVPAVMDRTIVQYDTKKESKRRERWQRIAKESAEQAHRLQIPEIAEIVSFRKWLEQHAAEYDILLIAYEAEHGRALHNVLADFSDRANKPVNVAVIIGPEGGLEAAEVEFAQQHGALPITLGPRILRTETAGVVVTAVILYHFGEMGG